MTAKNEPGTHRWVFECTECGETWINPDAPVSGHWCDHPEGYPGMPKGEPAEVKCIDHPGRDSDE